MSLLDPSMEELPVEVMVDILSRLPVKTIIWCKCVCKKWLNIVLDSYFADLQLLRSPDIGIMVHHKSEKEMTDGHIPGILKWVEVKDELDHQHYLHHDPVMSLDLDLSTNFQKCQIGMVGSVDGLLCLWQFGPGKHNAFICNPITREYIILPRKQKCEEDYYSPIIHFFGVVGLVTKEYKVIRISQEHRPPNPTLKYRPSPSPLKAEVYTLGSGQWRSLGHIPYWLNRCNVPFLNGHAHLIVANYNSPEKICAFDFDKETFKLFPSPPCEELEEQTQVHYQSLGVLKGCLCLCDICDYKVTVWVMKEYEIKKSWHKELVIETDISPNFYLPALEHVYLMESFKYGAMLVLSSQETLLVYCPTRKTFVYEKLFDGCLNGLPYRPSFHRLHSFKNETVHVF